MSSPHANSADNADGADSTEVTIDSAPLPRRDASTRPPLPLLPPAIAMAPSDDVPPAIGRAAVTAKRPTARLVLTAVVATAAAVVSVAYATTHSERADLAASSPTSAAATAPGTAAPTPAGSSTGGATATLKGPQRSALTWVTANLPRRTAILADPASALRLSALGFTAVSTATTLDAAPSDYVVAGAALRADPAARSTLARSVPVARFGTGDDAVEVRSVLGGTADRAATVLAADRANRRTAGAALAANPRITSTAAVRAVLRSGALDLRAATFLALLSAQAPVRVVSAPVDPAAAGLDRPRRTLTLAASSIGAAAVRSAAAALPDDYRPTGIDLSAQGSSQALTLTWSPTARPVEPVT